jgi:ubiquinone/menaquinone biosynthesis C-methylase UbiE
MGSNSGTDFSSHNANPGKQGLPKIRDGQQSQLLSSAVFYAPTPALTLDTGHRVIDYNIALEALVGPEVSGCRDRPLGEFLDLVTPRVEGSMLSPQLTQRGGEAPADGPEGHADGPTECVLRSDDFGRIRLACTALEGRDSAAGHAAGILVLWELREVEREDALHRRYRKLLDHQLTWDRYAWSYDRILTVMPYYQEVLSRHRAALEGVEDGPVIDIGAGTGNLVAMLVEGCPRVIAVEYSRAMLDRLRRKLAGHIGRELEVIEANAERLPRLAGESFGGVSILLSLYDMERPADTLSEAIRLLRSGGTLVITEPKLSFDIELILAKCREHLEQIGRYAELVEDLDHVNSANRVLDPASRESHATLHAEAIREHLERRGFRELTMNDSHFGQCATIRGTKP